MCGTQVCDVMNQKTPWSEMKMRQIGGCDDVMLWWYDDLINLYMCGTQVYMWCHHPKIPLHDLGITGHEALSTACCIFFFNCDDLMIHHTCGVCNIMYHIWSYVDSMFDNLVICWSDGGSRIFLFNSSAGFQRWVTWLQGEMASHTHISPSPLRKNSQIWMHAHPKSATGKNPRRGRTSFINTFWSRESRVGAQPRVGGGLNCATECNRERVVCVSVVGPTPTPTPTPSRASSFAQPCYQAKAQVAAALVRHTRIQL